MSPKPPLLSVEGLALSYGRIQAVRDVALDVAPGEVLGLCGHNGAGKSSIVRILSGQVMPDAGAIRLDGAACRFTSVRDAQRQGIALVDQELSVIPALTVAENLALGEVGLGLGGRLSQAQVRARLDAVGLEDLDPATYLEDLSIGQRQLVEIARAMGRNARLFILDEPTATLTAGDIAHVFAAVHKVAARGCGVIYVSHRLDEVLEHCDRVVVMRDGMMVGSRPTADLSGEALVTLMLGHAPAPLAGESAAPPQSKPVLAVRGLKSGALPQEFDLELPAGMVTALAGQVGSGASDVLRAVAGLVPEATGQVDVAGQRLKLGDPRCALGAGIGFVSADRKGEGLFLSRPIAENLVATRLRALSPQGVLPPERLRREAARIALSVGVDGKRIGEPVSRLSGGNQQKVFLGRCFARDDLRVLLLDEPTRGVDAGGRADIHGLIRAIAARGVAVLVASSDLDEVLALADQVVVMRGGQQVSRRVRSETDSARLLIDMTRADAERRT